MKANSFSVYAKKYSNLIRMKVCKATRDPLLRSDLTQECLIILQKAIETYREDGPANEFTWVNTVLNNKIINCMKKIKIDKKLIDSYQDDIFRPQYQQSFLLDLIQDEIIHRMHKILDNAIKDEEIEKENMILKFAKRILNFKLNLPNSYHEYTQQDIADLLETNRALVSDSMCALRSIFDLATEEDYMIE